MVGLSCLNNIITPLGYLAKFPLVLVSLHPSQQFSVMLGWGFLGLTSTKLRIKCLALGHNVAPPVKLKPKI